MKKKLFAMYALVGALVASPVFTSCIDDTESASVTAVRTQKAEAMRIANQIAAANAELKIQAEKLQYEMNIANYEAQIVNYEKNLLTYQKQLKEAEDALKNYGVKTLSDLTDTYTTALSNVATTEWNIVKYNQQIEALKEGYLSAEKALADQIETKNGYIATAQAKIDQLNEWIENGSIDEVELNNQIAELAEAQRKLYNNWNLLKAEYGSFELERNEFTGKYEWVDENDDDVKDADEFEPVYDYNGEAILATVKAARELKSINPNYITTDAEGYLILSEVSAAGIKTTAISTLETAEKNLANAVAELGTEADTKDVTYLSNGVNIQTLYAALAEAQEAYNAAEKVYTEKKAAYDKAVQAKADAQTAYDAENGKATPDATKLAELNTALNTATTALNDAQTALATPESDYNTAKTTLNSAESAVLTAKDNLVSLEKSVADAEKTVENIDAWIAAFSGDDYAAYKEAKDAIEDAYKAWSLALAEENALRDLKDTLNRDNANVTVEGKHLTFAEAIEYYEAQIEGYKEDIAELKAVYRYNNVAVDSEEMLAVAIAYIEKQIAIEEVKLAIYTKQAEEAKAALDAYLAE